MTAIAALWTAFKGSKFVMYALVAGAFVLIVLGAVFRLIGMGRAAERGEAAAEALKRTQQANLARQKASQPITKEEEDASPDNRDHR